MHNHLIARRDLICNPIGSHSALATSSCALAATRKSAKRYRGLVKDSPVAAVARGLAAAFAFVFIDRVLWNL